MSGTVEPLAGATPPHPLGVSRVLKHSTRSYLSGGTSLTIVTDPIATFAHTVAKVVTGTITRMGPDVPMPTSVSLAIKAAAVTETTVTGTVTQATGVWTATIPANALAAGAKTAIASTSSPAGTAASVAFTVT